MSSVISKKILESAKVNCYFPTNPWENTHLIFSTDWKLACCYCGQILQSCISILSAPKIIGMRKNKILLPINLFHTQPFYKKKMCSEQDHVIREEKRWTERNMCIAIIAQHIHKQRHNETNKPSRVEKRKR